MLTKETQQNHLISGASSNPLLDTCMSSQPYVFSHEEIIDLVEAGYLLNEIIIENQTPNEIRTQVETEIEIQIETPNETRPQLETEIETEFETPNEIENPPATKTNNVYVDMKTPIENETCLNDNQMNENFEIKSDVLDNLPGLVSWRQITTHANRLFKHFFYNKKFGFQCQLMVQLIKMNKMRKVRKKLHFYV